MSSVPPGAPSDTDNVLLNDTNVSRPPGAPGAGPPCTVPQPGASSSFMTARPPGAPGAGVTMDPLTITARAPTTQQAHNIASGVNGAHPGVMGVHPSAMPGVMGVHPSAMPGAIGGVHPSAMPGAIGGMHPSAMPGAIGGVHPSAMPGAIGGMHPSVMPGASGVHPSAMSGIGGIHPSAMMSGQPPGACGAANEPMMLRPARPPAATDPVMSAKPPGTVDPQTHTFIVPEKGVKNPLDIAKWEKSQAYQDLMGFLLAMNESVKNTKISDECPMSQLTNKLVSLLDQLSAWIDETPPLEQAQRFGNKAYRTWFTKLKENAESLLAECLDEKFHLAIPEIAVYLVESVGNSTRIDYGTGHELSFIAFLCCLYRIGAYTEQDAKATVLQVFVRYITLMRKLQTVYRMEPAGSQGVWSLDDYHFVTFIWGSAQLLDHQRIKPKSFPNPDICEAYAKEYLFLACIHYIHQVKTGPFAEHSNQLWNVSGVQLWSKVNSGLFKMYRAEILNKFPVIQHFLFGSLLTLQPAT